MRTSRQLVHRHFCRGKTRLQRVRLYLSQRTARLRVLAAAHIASNVCSETTASSTCVSTRRRACDKGPSFFVASDSASSTLILTELVVFVHLMVELVRLSSCNLLIAIALVVVENLILRSSIFASFTHHSSA